MIVQSKMSTDKMSAPTPREIARRLYDKTIELENKRRRAARDRVPSEINSWQQIRENYEQIILIDHSFSEQYSIEYALWQLHYKRIEEFRAHFSAAHASGSSTTQNAKGPSKSIPIEKIRLQFKSFLSEATGFYHDLIMKIKSKYGLPLNQFSDELKNQIISEKDPKKYADMKNGLVSWHRCLIYLGDISRYRGMYGDPESNIRDFAAASGCYLEASSLWPSSGNPHHQLAILASYSGDQLLTVYRYFRSLAIEYPFLTAKENLTVAFDKNRQAYGLLSKNPSPASNVKETYKSFCVQFVRLNGIIFTRTSLETFAEVLDCVISSINLLLSSGPEEKFKSGKDDEGNGIFIVRVAAMLIFSADNVKSGTKGQSYAEILQRKVLVENVFTAVFDLMGHIMNKCKDLEDLSSSCLLPGILVFVEWLASYPDLASCTEVDDKQAKVKNTFWNYFVAVLNKILLDRLVVTEDEDETCFFNMSAYEEGENENRLALWEDFELRGFLPLTPAHKILDFSRQHFPGSSKEKKARAQRIFAAGKVLAKVVKVDQKSICFDSTLKKFCIGVESIASSDKPNLVNQVELQHGAPEIIFDKGMLQSNGHHFNAAQGDVDEEDEVIVFKPTVNDKPGSVAVPSSTPHANVVHDTYDVSGGLLSSSVHTSIAQPINHNHGQAEFQSNMLHPAPVQNKGTVPQYSEPIQSLSWSMEQLANGLTGAGFVENGLRNDSRRQVDVSMSYPIPLHMHQMAQLNTNGAVYGQYNHTEANLSYGFRTDASMNVPFPESSRKSPISRPHRHLGPPPGFNSVPRRQTINSMFPPSSETKLIDGYSWSDGYHLPIAMSVTGSNSSYNNASFHAHPQLIDANNNMFPFPGMQVTRIPSQSQQVAQQSHMSLEHLGKQNELQYQYQQQLAQIRLQNNPSNSNLPDHKVA